VSENVKKLIGVVVMAVLVVVGVLFTGGDDDESVSFQRNAAILGQVPMGGDLAELEFRIQRLEKLIGQVPELTMLLEVLERAESSLLAINSASVSVEQAKQAAIEEIAGVEALAGLDLRDRILALEENDHVRALVQAWFDFYAEIEPTYNDVLGRVGTLEREVGELIPRIEAQLTQIAPQFGPEFPGLGPMVDMICRNQLASWGVNARAVEAVWSPVWEFWACAYTWIEMEGYQQPVDLAFCLPGQEFAGRVDNGFNHRLESNGRISGDFGRQENGPFRFDDVCAVPVN